MKTEIRKVSPQIAEKMLTFNTSNRSIKNKIVTEYAREMRRGEWKLTGESIKISKNNRLLDGQHRLLAIIKSGVTIELLIITDLQDDIFNVLDTGTMRTAGDVLSIDGFSRPANIAAVSRFILNYNNGVFSSGSQRGILRSTNKDIQKFVNDNPEIIEISNELHKDYKQFKLLSISLLTGMYFILSKRSILDVEVFFEKLINGIDLEKGSPIIILRERLIRDQANRTRLKQSEKIHLIITAWNYYRKGTSVSHYKLDSNNPIPKPI